MNIFGAPSSIGSRAIEYLDLLLNVHWTPEQADELEAILKTLGSSFHRAELRAILKKLRVDSNVPSSNKPA